MNAFEALSILGLGSEATQEQIQAAYRKKARENHPDIRGKQSNLRMARINEAYESLKDYGPQASPSVRVTIVGGHFRIDIDLVRGGTVGTRSYYSEQVRAYEEARARMREQIAEEAARQRWETADYLRFLHELQEEDERQMRIHAEAAKRGWFARKMDDYSGYR